MINKEPFFNIKIQVRKMVQLASSVTGIALNFENENVGLLSLVVCTGSILDVLARKAMLGHVVHV